MAKFPPFSLIFPILGHFTGSWISCVVGYFLGLRFKAKKVTFRELFRVLRKRGLFGSKTGFYLNFRSGAKIRPFWPQNRFFRLWASKNLPRTLCLTIILSGGRQGRILSPKVRFWGPETEKEPHSAQKRTFGGLDPQGGLATLKTSSIS